MSSSWYLNKMKREDKKDEDIYILGTRLAGTDKTLEESGTGYNPVMIDRRGNRRFHGAFTGGFSAGHFNTVGSVQGYKAKYESWTSSRNNKNKQRIKQTPMDFMDDEDMATNTNLLKTSKEFDSLNNDSMKQFDQNKAKINNAFGEKMSDYLVVDKNAVFDHTKGIQLLKQCGWRAGKKIGDKSNIMRLKLLLKKQEQLLMNKDDNDHSDMSLLFGQHILNTDKDNDKQDEDEDNTFMSIYRPKRKTDLHGLGYDATDEHKDFQKTKMSLSGHKRLNCDDQNDENKTKFGPLRKKRRLLPSIASARHGLSALEEVEIGDDVYGDDMDQHIGYNTFIAHSDQEDDDDAILIKDRDRKSLRDRHRNKTKEHPKRHKKVRDDRARSKDGTLPIPGFVVDSIPDDYEYSLKQQIRANNYNRNKNNYRSHYNGYKQFKSNKMEIDKEFLDKFKDIDLTVGSFLCRNQTSNSRDNQRKIRSNVLSHLSSSVPRFIPDAQQKIKEEINIAKEKKNLSMHLSSNFSAAETMTSDQSMGGLSAGLTLASHLPTRDNKIQKANDILSHIRNGFGDESADKLLRFDVFLANKLEIESPIDTNNNLLIDDGNKTQFELNQEKYQFEERWNELKEHKEYLYPDKPRLNTKLKDDKSIIITKRSNLSEKEAAKQNLYGPLTRSTEMWIPDRLLCKRCNIRDPFQGMYKGDTDKSHLDQRTEQLFGGLLLNKSKNKKKSDRSTTTKTKGEEVVELLDETESDKQPPILQLKQLKTWNSYLHETKVNDTQTITKVDKEEMKSFMDGILNDSDSDSDDGDNNSNIDKKKKEKKKTKESKIEMQQVSLFKSIFENDNDSSDSNESESSQSEEEDVITNIKEADNTKDKDNNDDIEAPIQRKKFKFVSAANRNIDISSNTKFGSIGIINKEKRFTTSNQQKQEKIQLALFSDSDEDGQQNITQQLISKKSVEPAKEEMVWTIIDNDSSNSSENNKSEDDNIGSSKRKKHKKKTKTKKKKHKKSKRKKSKHKSHSKSRKSKYKY